MPEPREFIPPPKPGEPDPELDRRRRTAHFRVLPDFLIIGAMKAGTTSLNAYLYHHDLVHRARRKEVHYFDNNTHRGLLWYRAHFPTRWDILKADARAWLRRAARTTTGEASPYYLFHPHAAARAARVLPKARLIAMLRDPADRAYSHYQHNKRQGLDNLSFEDALDAEAERTADEWRRMLDDPEYNSLPVQHFTYATRGEYWWQVERWLEHFPREQLLVIRSEPFFADPKPDYDRTLAFLGLPQPTTTIPFVVHNDGGDYQQMSPATRERLAERFKEPNRRLALLLGEEPWWSDADRR
ncbi:MAG: sulfotransferase domain-containing protein [Phycisphaeraceae bacterium]|nr:sulfotransferase domain-containing protein [Phycisphaeraceae bacterium]